MIVALCFSVAFEAAAAGYPDYYPNTHRNTGSHIADLIGVAKPSLVIRNLTAPVIRFHPQATAAIQNTVLPSVSRTAHGALTSYPGALLRQASPPLSFLGSATA